MPSCVHREPGRTVQVLLLSVFGAHQGGAVLVGSASEWARETFGDAVGELVDLIPACLLRARNGHEGVHTQARTLVQR